MNKIDLYTNKSIDFKGQKIAAAIYLVTNHLSDIDPIKSKLRELSVELLVLQREAKIEVIRNIFNLLEVAVLAGMVSVNNSKLLGAELQYYQKHQLSETDALVDMLKRDNPYNGHFIDKKTEIGDLSLRRDTSVVVSHQKKLFTKEIKNKRQDSILSLINERRSLNIKDIATLFPSVSEKTIQRELGTLVSQGKISKRGDKRWSIYIAVN